MSTLTLIPAPRRECPLYTDMDYDKKRLTPKEEKDLISQAQKGGPGCAAEQTLVEANQGLCHTVARKFASVLLPYEDAYSWAQIGLLVGIRKFDLEEGGRLSTYATWWMRQSVSRAIDNEARAIRLPSHILEKQRLVQRRRDQLQSELQREPTDDEVFEASGLTLKEWKNLQAVPEKPLDLDHPLPGNTHPSSGAGGGEHAETLGSTQSGWLTSDLEKPEDWPEREELRDLASRMMARVRKMPGGTSQRKLVSTGAVAERVLRMRYGLEPYAHTHSLQQVADALVADGLLTSCSRENVRQYERRALQVCRDAARALGFKPE